ncbi:MAG TPA: thioredoxin domain-containing protein [Patescibacteria group bacterium]|nr:thioredoxin domain-containing protein [Patescibacteria group bacterium]
MTRQYALITGGITLFIMFVAGLFWLAAQEKNTTSSDDSTVTRDAAVTEMDHIKGNTDAPITLVEYSDFQCPACASYYDMLRQLSAAFPNDVRIAYRHYPLERIHKNAFAAARAAEAAGAQGRFWDMHDLLFEKQDEFAQSTNSEDLFRTYAASLNLDTEQFSKDFSASTTEKKIRDDMVRGNAIDLQGTPTFTLNGEKIENPLSLEEFKRLITERLAAGK